MQDITNRSLSLSPSPSLYCSCIVNFFLRGLYGYFFLSLLSFRLCHRRPFAVWCLFASYAISLSLSRFFSFLSPACISYRVSLASTSRERRGVQEEKKKKEKDKLATIYTIINRRRSSPLPNYYWQRIFSFPFFPSSLLRLYLYLRLLLFTIIIIIDIVSLLRYTYRSYHRHRRYYSSALLRNSRQGERPTTSEKERESGRAHTHTQEEREPIQY